MSENKGRKVKKTHEEEHEEHVDERWLVSYADMMTLLFGLFVILFSIASEKEGNFKENLKSISQSATKMAEQEETPPPPPEVNHEKEKQELATKMQEYKQQAEQAQQLLKEQMTNLENNQEVIKLLKAQLAEADVSKTKIAGEQDEAKKILIQNEQLKQEMERLKLQNNAYEQAKNQKNLEQEDSKKLAQENLKLKEDLEKIKNKPVEPVKKDNSKQVVAENETLKSKIEKLEKEIEKKEDKIAALSKTSPAPVIDKQKIERTISSLQDKSEQSKKEIEEKVAEIKDLNRKMASIEEENKKLKDQLKENDNKNSDNKTYLFVLFKWSTEKHDLDLTVTDPKGHVFSFKKKSYSGSSGLFSLDSRTGPGAEIWQSNNPTVGRYTVVLKMYNNYGNLDPAQVSGSILSNKTSIPISDKQIDSKSGSQLKFVFEVDEKGVIRMQ